MRCKKCNAELFDDLKFCPFCGEPLEQEKSEEKEPVNQEEQPQEYVDEIDEQEQKAKSKKVFEVFLKIAFPVSIVSLVINTLILLLTVVGYNEIASSGFSIEFSNNLTIEFSIVSLVFASICKKNLGENDRIKTTIVLSIIGIIIGGIGSMIDIVNTIENFFNEFNIYF